ncbi:MAG TPA: cupredoxin domain-containing protein [Tepidisphaeraceae bacterium]|nr:cupredoxin domain-containing protein [Tepidisphaeraceae bacterium]
MRFKIHTATRLALIFLLALATSAPAPAGSRKSVSIAQMKFAPDTLDIKIGDTVVWTNSDDRDHTVVAQNGAFKSDNIRPGSTFIYQFSKAGTFTYGCSYHPRMTGKIMVSEK